jgi:uncharacterized protein
MNLVFLAILLVVILVYVSVDKYSIPSFADVAIKLVGGENENSTFGNLTGYDKVIVTINGYNISAFVADTNEKRTNGLSRVEKLNKDQGMLFILDYPSKQGFWMKEMNFPIDIIWISDNHTVTDIKRNLEPCVSIFMCPVYSPSLDAKYVLETSAGYAESHSIAPGSEAVINIRHIYD